MPKPDVSTLARLAAVHFEDGIRQGSVEVGALIAPDGRIVVRRTGQRTHVSFTVGELCLIAGLTLTHNHPGGSGPSLDDVVLCAQFCLKEVRVVTAKHRYGVGMLRPAQVAPLSASFAAEHAKAVRSCNDDVIRNLLNARDFHRAVIDRTWRRLSSAIGFEYWEEES